MIGNGHGWTASTAADGGQHLHFEVMDDPDLLAGEGLPYLIDPYEIRSQDGSLDGRANELLTLETLINFRPAELISN